MRKIIYGLFAMAGAILSSFGAGDASASIVKPDLDNSIQASKSTDSPLVFSDVINQNDETLMAYHYSHRSHSSHSSHSSHRSHYSSRF